MPRIHKKGRSFLGLGRYVLHDRDTRETAERVAWTYTKNLGTNNPATAVRVMAATAMDADRLKAQSGVPNTGRKSRDAVLHFSLSWSDEESSSLTKAEMVRAAHQALHSLGASDRQALIVAHRDGPAHVHVITNRVCPETGRMLPSSYEKDRIQAWALAYERERGRVICHQREANAQARELGKYTRDESHTPYHIHEAESEHRGHPVFEETRRRERRLDAELLARRGELEHRHARAWADVDARQSRAVQELGERSRRDEWASQREVHKEFVPARSSMGESHRRQTEAWHANERSLLGRVKNAWAATDWARALRTGERVAALRDAYDAFSSSGARLAALRRSQDEERRELRRREIEEERRRAEAVRARAEAERASVLALFEAERHSLVLRHRMEDAAERARWRQRNDDRRAAYEHLAAARPSEPPVPAPSREADDRRRRVEDIRQRQRQEERGRGRD